MRLLLYNMIVPFKFLFYPFWTPHDYVIHILNGQKTWITSHGTTTLRKGDTAFIKKGGYIVRQDFSENFCLLIFFIKDSFKLQLSFDHIYQQLSHAGKDNNLVLYHLKSNPSIEGYFKSILSYFQLNVPPPEAIAKLKFQELLYILATEVDNHAAITQMITAESSQQKSLEQIMSLNYMYNLTLENYAELCNRSLSTFKRDFAKYFNTSPGKWLCEKRIRQAATLLFSTKLSISEIAFDCGFENLSHFSKSFKMKMKITPKAYRAMHA